MGIKEEKKTLLSALYAQIRSAGLFLGWTLDCPNMKLWIKEKVRFDSKSKLLE